VYILDFANTLNLNKAFDQKHRFLSYLQTRRTPISRNLWLGFVYAMKKFAFYWLSNRWRDLNTGLLW